MEFLNEYMLPMVLGICLCIGYVIKKWIKDVDNKYIPTLCAILGVVISSWMNGFSFTPQVVLGGMVSGLASTGMHQLFTQYLDKRIS